MSLESIEKWAKVKSTEAIDVNKLIDQDDRILTGAMTEMQSAPDQDDFMETQKTAKQSQFMLKRSVKLFKSLQSVEEEYSKRMTKLLEQELAKLEDDPMLNPLIKLVESLKAVSLNRQRFIDAFEDQVVSPVEKTYRTHKQSIKSTCIECDRMLKKISNTKQNIERLHKQKEEMDKQNARMWARFQRKVMRQDEQSIADALDSESTKLRQMERVWEGSMKMEAIDTFVALESTRVSEITLRFDVLKELYTTLFDQSNQCIIKWSDAVGKQVFQDNPNEGNKISQKSQI